MKSIPVILLAFICMLFSCKKNNACGKIKGKLVYTSCATAVVEIKDAAYYSLGQASWQQSAGKPTYRNVFTIINRCSFDVHGIKEGDEFYFTITNTGENGCAICALWDNPPAVAQKISVVK